MRVVNDRVCIEGWGDLVRLPIDLVGITLFGPLHDPIWALWRIASGLCEKLLGYRIAPDGGK